MFAFRTFVGNSFRILVKFKWNVGFMEFHIGHERMELMCTNAQKLFDTKKMLFCVRSYFAYTIAGKEGKSGRVNEME